MSGVQFRYDNSKRRIKYSTNVLEKFSSLSRAPIFFSCEKWVLNLNHLYRMTDYRKVFLLHLITCCIPSETIIWIIHLYPNNKPRWYFCYRSFATCWDCWVSLCLCRWALTDSSITSQSSLLLLCQLWRRGCSHLTSPICGMCSTLISFIARYFKLPYSTILLVCKTFWNQWLIIFSANLFNIFIESQETVKQISTLFDT